MPPRANSCRFDLARISAPALRILATVKASAGGTDAFMLTLPPVVGRSRVLFEDDRNAVQRPDPRRTCLIAAVHLARNLHGFGIYRDDRAQCGALHVVGCDPVEVKPGQLRAGQLAGGERSVDAGNRRLLETKWVLLRACW